MKYVFITTALAFIAAFYAAVSWLPDPLYYLAGSQKGEVYASGYGIYGFAFYIAVMVAMFGVFMPALLLQESWQARRNGR